LVAARVVGISDAFNLDVTLPSIAVPLPESTIAKEVAITVVWRPGNILNMGTDRRFVAKEEAVPFGYLSCNAADLVNFNLCWTTASKVTPFLKTNCWRRNRSWRG
jgi:hypothetical protein